MLKSSLYPPPNTPHKGILFEKKLSITNSSLSNIPLSEIFSLPNRLGKLKISDNGIFERDELVIDNFFSNKIPLCGVLGGGYNEDFNKLVELHSSLHKTCAKFL